MGGSVSKSKSTISLSLFYSCSPLPCVFQNKIESLFSFAEILAKVVEGKPKLTAGLNIPPLTRYQTNTLVARLNPKMAEIYDIWIRLGPGDIAGMPNDARSVMSAFSLPV